MKKDNKVLEEALMQVNKIEQWVNAAPEAEERGMLCLLYLKDKEETFVFAENEMTIKVFVDSFIYLFSRNPKFYELMVSIIESFQKAKRKENNKE